jgi:hypothetical protein
MAVTTPAQEAVRLRQYLNPAIRGPVVNAVLGALSNPSAYLVNSVQAVNDSLYVVTAQGNYLDLLLANYGITRDPTIGLSDDIFRTIGIQVKNRKQVRDLINNILDAVFGDLFVKADSSAQTIEPYALQDGDTLIVNFDGTPTQTITFFTAQFTSIAAATAQEVANAISIGLSNLGVSGSAIVNNSGNGNYVELVSDTIGASSSVTVLGGRSQNVFLFPSQVAAGGNFSTQWTISNQSGGLLRFTWTGGANPDLGVVEPLQYVNIFGGGFASSDLEGSFPIVSSQGGAVGIAYFQISNPTGTTGIVVQGTDSAILFYTPTRETILSKQYYAAVYQTEANILQIFMPATTQVIKRSRIGSMHLHGVTETPVSQFIIPAAVDMPASGAGEYYLIDDQGPSFQYYFWFNVDGGNTDPAPAGFIGVEVDVSSGDSAPTVANEAYVALMAAIPLLTYTISDNVITLTNVTASTVADAGPSLPTTLGPYIFDTSQSFVVGGASTTLTEDVNGETSHVITVASSDGFPNSSGHIIIGYGTENQEGPIPYIASPSSGTLLISPAYFLKQDHPIGSSVLLVIQDSPITLPSNGSYYQGYLTDTASGRVYAQNLIDTITAAGVTVIYTVLFPNSIGLGGWESPTPGANEISYVYGP